MSNISSFLPVPPDNFSTQISTPTIGTTDLTIGLDSVAGLATEGVGVLFKKDSDGVIVPGSIEFIHWTGISGSSITLTDTGDRGVTGSDAGAQSYVADDYFEVWVSSYYQPTAGILQEHNTDGTHSDVTADSLTLAGTSAPAPTTQGLVKYDSDDDKVKYGDGSSTRVVVTEDQTATLTNKRVNSRTTTETSSATPTINTDNTDIHTITALAAAITSFTTNLSGTPTNGQKLIIRIKDDGTARAITWGASFASRGATLPTTTTISKTTYVGLIWNSTASTWDCVAVATES